MIKLFLVFFGPFGQIPEWWYFNLQYSYLWCPFRIIMHEWFCLSELLTIFVRPKSTTDRCVHINRHVCMYLWYIWSPMCAMVWSRQSGMSWILHKSEFFCICIYKGVQFKLKLLHTGTWLAAVLPPCCLFHCSEVFFHHLHLIMLSFLQRKTGHTFQKHYSFHLYFSFLFHFLRIMEFCISWSACIGSDTSLIWSKPSSTCEFIVKIQTEAQIQQKNDF
jgi:hypothetical protein